MKIGLRLILAVLIVFVGVRSILQELKGHELGLFSEFQYLPFLFLAILTIIAFFFDTRHFKVDKKIYRLVPSFVGLLFCIIVIARMMHRNSIENSLTILKASSKAGATDVQTFDFQEQGNLQITEYYKFGQTVYYGKYLKLNDTLKVLNSNYAGFAKDFPKVGLMKNDTLYWNNGDYMLVDKE